MDKAARSAHARALVDDPMLMEALANIRLAAIQKWEATSVSQPDAREIAWLTVKVVNRIEAELQSIIDDGLIAAKRVQNPIR